MHTLTLILENYRPPSGGNYMFGSFDSDRQREIDDSHWQVYFEYLDEVNEECYQTTSDAMTSKRGLTNPYSFYRSSDEASANVQQVKYIRGQGNPGYGSTTLKFEFKLYHDVPEDAFIEVQLPLSYGYKALKDDQYGLQVNNCYQNSNNFDCEAEQL